MKIDIIPRIIYASDYHYFYKYDDKNFAELGFKMSYFEIESSHKFIYEFYGAIIWPDGAEDELFEFIFTNQEAWEALIKGEN